MLELPEGHKFDPGIAWDDIGIDMLIVDEAAAFKNSYKPEAREHGLPKFMGSGGDGSKRACGDGFINTGEEECEDGNGDNNDGCLGCEFAVCGDGWVYTGVEECDDGNDQPDDACSELCKFNP